jgi:hypothetical protein
MTIGEFFARVWEMLIGRADGPFTLRLILQPAVAAIFAMRAGLRDAREGRPPFFSGRSLRTRLAVVTYWGKCGQM